MSLEKQESKKRDTYIGCSCGTHGIKLTFFDDEDCLYLSIFSDNFYNKQKDTFYIRWKKKIKFIWSIIRGKEYLLEEFVLEQEDIELLLNSLNKVKNK